MDIVDLKVYKREKTGKEIARKLRKEGKIPAVLYGHEINPIPLVVDARELFLITHGDTRGSQLVKLSFPDSKKTYTALIKQVDKHPLREDLLHIDFQKVKMDEKITSTVPLNIIGEEDCLGIKEGGVMQHGVWEIEIYALPTELPEKIDVDISELNIGDSIKVADLEAPAEVEITSEDEEVVISIITPTTYKEEVVEEEVEELEEVAEGEEAEEEGEAKEGEEKKEESEGQEQ